MKNEFFVVTHRNGASLLMLGINMAVSRGIDKTLQAPLPEPVKEKLVRRKIGILQRRIDLIDAAYPQKDPGARNTMKMGIAYEVLWLQGYRPPFYQRPGLDC